jgi:hypothetical protein
VQLDLTGLNLNQDLWLGVVLGTDDEMSPRVQILPSPSSIFSATTDRSYGEMYVYNNTQTTTISAINTFTMIAPTTLVAGPLNYFTYSSANPGRLTYGGTATKIFLINMSLTASPTGVSPTASFSIFKNGVQMIDSQIVQELLNGKKTSVSLTALVSLSTGDYIEAYVSLNTITLLTNFVFSYLNYNVTEAQ